VSDPLSTEPLVLFDFKTREDVENNWRVSSDASFGGCSSGHISLVDTASSCSSSSFSSSSSSFSSSSSVHHTKQEQQQEQHEHEQHHEQEQQAKTSYTSKQYCMRFEGVYSRDIDRERAHPRLKKSGFVSMTGRRMDSLDTYMDLECYKSLVYSIRVDCREGMVGERTFLANIRTDNWVIGGDGASEDVWQAVLHTSLPEDVGNEKDTSSTSSGSGSSIYSNSTTTTAAATITGNRRRTRPSSLHPSFVDVEIPLSEFILTWRGRVVDAPVELGRTKVTALGISILGNDEQEEGPFCMDVLRITALHESATRE
jgi:hypothetical protein